MADAPINTGNTIIGATTFVNTIAQRTKIELSVITSDDKAAKEEFLAQLPHTKTSSWHHKLHQIQLLTAINAVYQEPILFLYDTQHHAAAWEHGLQSSWNH